MSTEASTSPNVESSSDKLELQSHTPPNDNDKDKDEGEHAIPPVEQDVPRSRSASREPGTSPEKSDGSEGSDEEANSSSPMKTILPAEKSKSPSPTDGRKLSRSTSSPRRSESKPTSRKKQSRFVVCMTSSNVCAQGHKRASN